MGYADLPANCHSLLTGHAPCIIFSKWATLDQLIAFSNAQRNTMLQLQLWAPDKASLIVVGNQKALV